jgi:hypothetical protein
MLAQIDELHVRAEVLDDASGRVGDENLTAVARGADPGGAMHAEAVVAGFVEERLRRMDAHPDAHRAGFLKRALRVDGGCHRGPRSLEDHEEAVACRVDLVAAVTLDRPSQDMVVLVADAAPVGTKLPGEGGRPLDVGEQKRDSSLRQTRTAVGHAL